MNRIAPVLFLLALAAWVGMAPSPAPACAVAPPKGGRVDVSDEAALIVWDEATRTEHFIRRATFQTAAAYDFGFLVPTPTQPDLGEADDAVFNQLAQITAPKIETQTVTRPVRWGCDGGFMLGAKHERMAPGAAESAVVVLGQKRVGDHDTVTVKFRRDKADDPVAGAAELAAWLQRYGYAFGPNLVEWLTPYIKNDWVVTAFRMAISQPPVEPTTTAGATGKSPRTGANGALATGKSVQGHTPAGLRATAVRMSFKTDRPFYPYREPADQRDDHAKAVPRMLRVFVIAGSRFAGTLGSGETRWPGQVVWANTLPEEQAASITTPIKLPTGSTLPRAAWLTEFEDRSTPRPGTDEVYFASSGDPSPVARPPVIHYEYVDAPPYGLFGLIVGAPVVLAIWAMVLWRVLRRR